MSFAEDMTKASVSELRSFLTFLTGVWGALAALSIFFPLSNELSDVIPLSKVTDDPPGGFARIEPVVVSTVSTIAVLFAVLWLFGRRQELQVPGRAKQIRRKALLSLVAGFLLLVTYIAIYEVKIAYAFESWNWESDDVGHLLLEIPLMALYAGFFTCLTSAFVLLGLVEYFGKRDTDTLADEAEEQLIGGYADAN